MTLFPRDEYTKKIVSMVLDFSKDCRLCLCVFYHVIDFFPFWVIFSPTEVFFPPDEMTIVMIVVFSHLDTSSVVRKRLRRNYFDLLESFKRRDEIIHVEY